MEETLTGVLLVEAQLVGLYLDGIELFREGFALFFFDERWRFWTEG